MVQISGEFQSALLAEARRVAALLEPGAGVVVVGTGGRDFANYGFLCACMDLLRRELDIRFVSHGDAKGADRMFGLWARSRRIAERKLPITRGDWDSRGKSAGPRRNQALLDSFPRPDIVVAMPGGTGTADMICRSNQQGFPVIDTEEIAERLRA